MDEIREDGFALQRSMINMQLRVEGGLRAIDIIFLDRALPDVLAFCRIFGLDPNEFLPACFQRRYASVFVLNRFPYKRDGVRAADDATAEYLDDWIARDYGALGYNVVRITVMSPEERLAFVLESLRERRSLSKD
jgi:predicted ATPase